MSTKSPEFQQAKSEIEARLASSGADAGGSPVAGVAANVAPEGAEAPPSSDNPAASIPEPAPLTPPEKPGTANGGGSLLPIPANEPLEKWGTGGGIAWLAEYERMARLVAGTVTLPDTLKTPRDILAIALTGRELGIAFMESTRMIALIHGRPAIAAELKLKLARREGHDIRQVEDQTADGQAGEVVSVYCQTHNSDVVSFSLADAKRAKLIKPNGGYETYPEDLLWARAVTRLIRRHCPEVVGASLRSVEELSDTPAGGD